MIPNIQIKNAFDAHDLEYALKFARDFVRCGG